METKTHWKKLNNPDYLGAYSIAGSGKDLVVTIDHVKQEMVNGPDGKKEQCTVAHLVGEKPFILNVTNCKTISKIAGSPFVEEWKGLKISLYIASVKAFGETVDALRVRPQAPKLPELTPDNAEAWAKAKEAVKNGFTVAQIKSKWSISSNNEKLLLS